MSSQTELWSYFQTGRQSDFAGARNRLDSLLRIAGLPTGALLNIGCGDGYLERAALKSGWDVTSLDPDEKSVDLLRSSGIRAVCGAIESMPLPDSSMDVVIATEVFEHLTPEQLRAGLGEIRRVLKPSGRLIGTVPYNETLAENVVFCPDCRKSFHRWGHHQSFDEAAMRSYLASHFPSSRLYVRPFSPWNVLNWKGKVSAIVKNALSAAGIHGRNENLVFIAR